MHACRVTSHVLRSLILRIHTTCLSHSCARCFFIHPNKFTRLIASLSTANPTSFLLIPLQPHCLLLPLPPCRPCLSLPAPSPSATRTTTQTVTNGVRRRRRNLRCMGVASDAGDAPPPSSRRAPSSTTLTPTRSRRSPTAPTMPSAAA